MYVWCVCVCVWCSISCLLSRLEEEWTGSQTRSDVLAQCLGQTEGLASTDTASMLRPSQQLQRYELLAQYMCIYMHVRIYTYVLGRKEGATLECHILQLVFPWLFQSVTRNPGWPFQSVTLDCYFVSNGGLLFQSVTLDCYFSLTLGCSHTHCTHMHMCTQTHTPIIFT